MAYTPPSNDATDFTLEAGYIPPGNDATDFTEYVDQLVAVSQATTTARSQAVGTGQATTTTSATTTTTTRAAGVGSATSTASATATPATIVTAAAGTTTSTASATTTATAPAAGIENDAWAIGINNIRRRVAESVTPTTLTLSFRVTTDNLEAYVRPLKADEGKLDVIGTDDGGFRGIDRANGSNTYELTPPAVRQPLRRTRTYLVARYEESLVSQDVGEWDVELELHAQADRDDPVSISQTPAADEWGLTTRYGTIATPRVSADLLGTGEGGVERYELTARLTATQARAFESAYSRIGGGRVREIPDAPNVAVDDTSDDAVTLTVDAPDSQTVVSDGDYIVTEWESTRLSEAYQEVTLTVAST